MSGLFKYHRPQLEWSFLVIDKCWQCMRCIVDLSARMVIEHPASPEVSIIQGWHSEGIEVVGGR
jgi:hypothetical protein